MKVQPNSKIIRIKAVIIKEFYQLIRDPTALLIGFGLPIILLFLYGYGVSLDLKNLRIGLVLEDSSPSAQTLAQSFSDSPYFQVKVVKDRRELDNDIISGKIRGFVDVPSYFSDFLNKPNTPVSIQVIADGSETNTANLLHTYVEGAWATWLKQEYLNKQINTPSLINIEPRFWYNNDLESKNFLIPGSLAIIMTLIGTLLTALIIAREWEKGTMENLISTPITTFELLLGKLLPYFLLGMVSMMMCVLIGIGIYKVPFRGSILALSACSAIFLFTSLLLGLLISTFAKNQFVAAQASIVSAFLPSFILSGFIFDIASMPYPIQLLSYLIPARYFVSSLQTLFLAGNVWKLIIYDSLAVLLIGVVLLVIIIKKTVKRLD